MRIFCLKLKEKNHKQTSALARKESLLKTLKDSVKEIQVLVIVGIHNAINSLHDGAIRLQDSLKITTSRNCLLLNVNGSQKSGDILLKSGYTKKMAF